MKTALRFIALASFIGAACIAILTPAPIHAQNALQGTLQGTLIGNVNLRVGPGRAYARIAPLPADTQVTIEARSTKSVWLLVRADISQRGWVSAERVKFANNGQPADLPISTEIVPLSSAAVTAPPDTPDTTDNTPEDTPSTDTAAVNRPLTSYAAQITPAIRSAMRAVYLRGRALGNNPRVFSKVGDCLIGHVWFFSQYGDGKANDLGPYGGLQDVITQFSISPRAGILNSFTAESMAAHSAFTSAAVQDPLYANPAQCKADETPLNCEYRLNRPSVAIIMFGVVDVASMGIDDFDNLLHHVVSTTLAHGTIPVLVIAPENSFYVKKAAQFNAVVVKIAHQFNLPLINLRGALAALPDKGLDPDGIHLTPAAQFTRITFEQDSFRYGLPIWNLLALQSLDNVWRQIMH